MTRPQHTLTLGTLLTLVLGWPIGATAQERLCDPQYEDCRQPIIDLIRNERVGIDVEFWFMEDARYVPELINRFKAGVPVRILVDSRANASKRLNAQTLSSLAAGGMPMREKFGADILHHKVMLFQGQNVVEFSKANYTDISYVPLQPNVNYFDEAVYFSNDDRMTNSFRRRFDDNWVDTTNFRNYANITAPLTREYPAAVIDASMNFPPLQDFNLRAIGRMDAETQGIDALVFRVTDPRMSDAAIRAVNRGAPVRLISEPTEYRNVTRYLDAKEIDRMWMAGVDIKMRKHEGLMHEGSIVLHGLGEAIFGSSNWSPKAAAGYSDEHNFFYKPSFGKPWLYLWFENQFESRWNDPLNYVDFKPLPPDIPVYAAPADFASNLSSSVVLKWEGGPWAHLYDIYLGPDPNPPLLVANSQVGGADPGKQETFTVVNLQPGTTYYWRIVSKTLAQATKSGPTWSFTTSGTPPAGGGTMAFGGTPAAVPGTIQAENFDEGGQLSGYYDTSAGNAGGAYRSTDVDIEATTDTGGGFNLGKTRAGEWLKYTVNVSTTGTYTFDTRVANVGVGARFHVEVDGVDRTGPIAIPDTGGWQTWQTVSKTGVALTAGTRIIRVVLETVGSGGGAGNLNWFRLSTGTTTPPPPPPPPPSSTTPYNGSAASLPGVVQAENFDNGGSGVAYWDASAGNSGGTYRTTDVDLGPTTDPSSGGVYLGWTRQGEWLKYTVNVTQTRSYTPQVRVANVGTGAQFRIEVDGVDVAGAVTVPNTGGWDVWQTITLGAVPLTQGTHVLRLVMVAHNVENTGVGNFGFLAFQ